MTDRPTFRTRRQGNSGPLRPLARACVYACLIAAFLFQAQSAQPVHALSSGVVISQIYGGGGNTGATFQNDFIELFNRGSWPVSLAGMSVQYASAAGTTWQVTALTMVTLDPGEYFLVQEFSAAAIGSLLSSPDATDTINMSGTNGKVALVSNTVALSGACPVDPSIIDFIGYGATANCFEGTAAAPTLSNTTAAIRGSLGTGCAETDSNSLDFAAGTPTPRNTHSSSFNCTSPPGVVVISQIYGGGGNSGAPLTHDFIELFNRGASPVSLNGMSVQFASGGGTNWQVTALPDVVLQPGQYFLVQEGAGAQGDGNPLPAFDASGTIQMLVDSGKVALAPLTANMSGACPDDPSIVDFIGYGDATCFESAAAPMLDGATAAVRGFLGTGCAKTDNNSLDFSAGFVSPQTPRNTSSPRFTCAPPTGTGAAVSDSVQQGGQTLLTVTVAPAATPASTGLGVTADLTSISGSASQSFFDDGTNGDVTSAVRRGCAEGPLPGEFQELPWVVGPQVGTSRQAARRRAYVMITVR